MHRKLPKAKRVTLFLAVELLVCFRLKSATKFMLKNPLKGSGQTLVASVPYDYNELLDFVLQLGSFSIQKHNVSSRQSYAFVIFEINLLILHKRWKVQWIPQKLKPIQRKPVDTNDYESMQDFCPWLWRSSSPYYSNRWRRFIYCKCSKDTPKHVRADLDLI